jgi:AcrR family transcriptional regulator
LRLCFVPRGVLGRRSALAPPTEGPKRGMNAESPRRSPLRQRAWDATVEQIKTAAREELRRSSPGDLSLRAVARDVGLAPSALYRYFDSRDELLNAVALDAHREVGETLAATSAEVHTDGRARLHAMACTFRDWAVAHPDLFALVFTTRQPHGLESDSGSVPEGLGLVYGPLLSAYAEAMADGSVAPRRIPGAPSSTLLELAAAASPPLEDAALSGWTAYWSATVGWVTMEVYGQAVWTAQHPAEAFRGLIEETLGDPQDARQTDLKTP